MMRWNLMLELWPSEAFRDATSCCGLWRHGQILVAVVVEQICLTVDIKLSCDDSSSLLYLILSPQGLPILCFIRLPQFDTAVCLLTSAAQACHELHPDLPAYTSWTRSRLSSLTTTLHSCYYNLQSCHTASRSPQQR